MCPVPCSLLTVWDGLTSFPIPSLTTFLPLLGIPLRRAKVRPHGLAGAVVVPNAHAFACRVFGGQSWSMVACPLPMGAATWSA